MSKEGTNHTKTILVVDDDVRILSLLYDLLGAAGYRVRTARCGGTGLRIVAAEGLPDLIILELRMPGMSGRTFAERFRAKYGSTVPIMVVTGWWGAKNEIERIGAVAALDKPFDIKVLVEVVDRCVGRTE